jgi:predicted nucleic acid-binding protein
MSVPDTEPARCFVDTDIWPYALVDGDDLRKSARAKALLEASRAVIVSPQVINEVCVNLIKKAQFSEPQVQQLIESFDAKYVVVEVSKAVLLKASAFGSSTPSRSGTAPSSRVPYRLALRSSTRKTCKRD